jgi:hypothetical protein
VREGYEGLVRGNAEAEPSTSYVTPSSATHPEFPVAARNIINNLRFGDGELLKDGTGDYASGRTLKGRYIVRVGWDDVRGWFTEVRTCTIFSVTLLTYVYYRVVRLLEPRARRNSGPQKGDLQRHIT